MNHYLPTRLMKYCYAHNCLVYLGSSYPPLRVCLLRLPPASNECMLFFFPLFTFDILCGRIAITLMIFVNYGGGGYYFFGYAVWNGEYASYSLTQFAVYECLTYSNKKNDYELSLVNSCYICFFIIWHAPRAGSMRRILCSDWLPEGARQSDSARSGLPVLFPQ